MSLPGDPTPASRARLLLAVLVCGWLASLGYHILMGLLGEGYPLDTYLFRPHARFGDYFNNFYDSRDGFDMGTVGARVPHGVASVGYMGWSWVSYVLFFPWGMEPTLALMLGAFLATVYCWVLPAMREARMSRPDWITVLLMVSAYPVVFAVDRANAEVLIFIALVVGISGLVRRRTWPVVLGFGCALALKPYVILLFPLLAAQGRWRWIAGSATVALALTALAFVVLPAEPMEVLSYYRYSLLGYQWFYVAGADGMYFGSSLWGMFKTIAMSLGWVDTRSALAARSQLAAWSGTYFWFSVICAALLVTLSCMLRMPLWKRLVVLVATMNLLPFVCGDYRLVHWLLPMALFLRQNRPGSSDRLWALLFALILIPTSYYHFVFAPVYRVSELEVTDSVIVHPLVMLAMLALALTEVLRQPRLNHRLLHGLPARARLRLRELFHAHRH